MENKYKRLNQWRTAVCKSNLHKTTKCVLLVMSVVWMDENLHCFPSQRTIAEMVGCTPNTVNTHLKKAQNQGWILPTQNMGSRRGYRRNDYCGFIPTNYYTNCQ